MDISNKLREKLHYSGAVFKEAKWAWEKEYDSADLWDIGDLALVFPEWIKEYDI